MGWPSCQRFYAADRWGQQANYSDLTNRNDQVQDSFCELAKRQLSSWKNRTIFLRMLTKDAAKHMPDAGEDFIYVDARHDYCGVYEDVNIYWPKLRPGGIMTGYDYVLAREAYCGQDWSLCANGTRHPGAVKRAVDDFARERGLRVGATYADDMNWIIRTPE